MGREYIGSVATALNALRADDESSLITAFGSHGPSPDCRNGNMSVTIVRDGEEATSEAVHLQDAILLARAKVVRQIEAREKKREEARLARAEQGT